MATSPACSATTRDKGKLHICSLPIDHGGPSAAGRHRDELGFEWESDPVVTSGERAL